MMLSILIGTAAAITTAVMVVSAIKAIEAELIPMYKCS